MGSDGQSVRERSQTEGRRSVKTLDGCDLRFGRLRERRTKGEKMKKEGDGRGRVIGREGGRAPGQTNKQEVKTSRSFGRLRN